MLQAVNVPCVIPHRLAGSNQLQGVSRRPGLLSSGDLRSEIGDLKSRPVAAAARIRRFRFSRKNIRHLVTVMTLVLRVAVTLRIRSAGLVCADYTGPKRQRLSASEGYVENRRTLQQLVLLHVSCQDQASVQEAMLRSLKSPPSD